MGFVNYAVFPIRLYDNHLTKLNIFQKVDGFQETNGSEIFYFTHFVLYLQINGP